VPGPDDLQKALDANAKPDMTIRQKRIEVERAAVIADFPLADWPELDINRYALGTPGDSYCRRLEFQTPHLGSIRGGSAAKHIIYRRRSDSEWYRAGSLADLQINEAWSVCASSSSPRSALWRRAASMNWTS
jgi:5-methylcytosine-specific restriction enzyme B